MAPAALGEGEGTAAAGLSPGTPTPAPVPRVLLPPPGRSQTHCERVPGRARETLSLASKDCSLPQVPLKQPASSPLALQAHCACPSTQGLCWATAPPGDLGRAQMLRVTRACRTTMQSNGMSKGTSPTPAFSRRKDTPMRYCSLESLLKPFPSPCCSGKAPAQLLRCIPKPRRAQGTFPANKKPHSSIPLHACLQAHHPPASAQQRLEKSQNSATAGVFLGKAQGSTSTLEASASSI